METVSHLSGLTRRQALLQAMALVGGGLAVARCAPAGDPTLFSPRELAALEAVCDVLLPATDTPGAVAAGVPTFIAAMMRDWASGETRSSFKRLAEAFAEQPPERLAEWVQATDRAAYSAKGGEDWRRFKRLVLLGYYTSEPGATQELRHEQVPGDWVACEPVTAETRTWADGG
jgi:hypothetical protein